VAPDQLEILELTSPPKIVDFRVGVDVAREMALFGQRKSQTSRSKFSSIDPEVGGNHNFWIG